MDQPFTTPLGSNRGVAQASKITTRSPVKFVAERHDVAELGTAVGRRQLAPVEAVDLAAVLVGAEGRIDPVQPSNGGTHRRRHALGGRRLALGAGRRAYVEGDHRPHHRLVVDGTRPNRR